MGNSACRVQQAFTVGGWPHRGARPGRFNRTTLQRWRMRLEVSAAAYCRASNLTNGVGLRRDNSSSIEAQIGRLSDSANVRLVVITSRGPFLASFRERPGNRSLVE